MVRNLNHWKPEGEFFVGDCMPFRIGEEFHLFYLLDQGHHNHPLVGHLGGHQWAHAVSRDLVHWEHRALALPLDFEEGECSNCTGSLLEKDGKIYAFYALRSRKFKGEQFRVAISRDGGNSFRKWEEPLLKTPPPGRTGDFRDPEAFLGEDALVHVFLSGARIRSDGSIHSHTGELLHYSTPDLIHYRQEESVLHSWAVPECSDCFRWKGRSYLLYGNLNETRCCVSEQPSGPWETPRLDVPACGQCRVMKTAPWKDGRRIGVGWSATPEKGGGCFLFGGRTLFRELVQEKDGSLGTAFVPEMLPVKNRRALESVEAGASVGCEWKGLGMLPDSFRLDGTIRFSPEKISRFGIVVMDAEGEYRRFVEFDPHAGIVELDRIHSIRQVDLSSGVLRFRLLRTHELIDVEIDGRRTVALPGCDFRTGGAGGEGGCAVAFYAAGGNAVLENPVCFDGLDTP